MLRAFGACIVVVSLLVTPVAAQPYDKPLGIALEEWPYPHPVQFLPLEIEGQSLRMAYMDVAPAANANANGRVVMLFHGKNFFGGYWENTIKALAGAGYRVVVPDQIGFGKSSKPEIRYSFDLLAANTVKLLDHLKIDKAAIVGHSMGGMLAVRFVRNHPDRSSALILENPIGLEDYRFKVPPRSDEQVFAAELQQDEEKVRAYFKTYFPQWQAEYERWVEAPARVSLSGEFPRWAKASALTYQMIYQQPVRHEFPLITVPTLLVMGQEDRTTIGRGTVTPEVLSTLGQYPRLGQEAQRDIPGSKLVELPNVGHIPHLEAPDQFHEALLNFLGGIQ